MTTMTTWLALLMQAAGVFLAFQIWKEIERIRVAIERPNRPIIVTPSHSYGVPMPVFAIWVFSGGQWILDRKSIPDGYAPGSPPSFSGSFEGQRVKMECRKC